MANKELYRAPQEVDRFVDEYPALAKIANTPTAAWINDHEHIEQKVRPYSAEARKLGQVPLFVLYNAIQRNPEGHIDGSVSDGAGTLGAYKKWIDNILLATQTESIFILEPDATARGLDIGSNEPVLDYAITELAAAGHSVYVDVGHSDWVSAQQMANSIAPFVGAAKGISLNVSNYGTIISMA